MRIHSATPVTLPVAPLFKPSTGRISRISIPEMFFAPGNPKVGQETCRDLEISTSKSEHLYDILYLYEHLTMKVMKEWKLIRIFEDMRHGP